MPTLLNDENSFNNIIKASQLTVVHFAADWVEQCAQLDDVLETLGAQHDYSNVQFCKCQAEDLPEISLNYKIEAVPTIIFFRSGKVIDTVHGANAALLTAKVKEHHQSDTKSTGDQDNSVPLENRLKQLINKHKVMLFMKGDRDTPRCGFSKQIIQILTNTGITYDTFDILTDEEVRQGLKTFSDWPTYPQLYVNGELVGGLDIVKEMQAAGELESTLSS